MLVPPISSFIILTTWGKYLFGIVMEMMISAIKKTIIT